MTSEVSFEEEPYVADHYSHSQLALFSRCGEAYHRKYVNGELSPASLSMIAGKAFHTAMENFIQGEPNMAKSEYHRVWQDTPPTDMVDEPTREQVDTIKAKMWLLSEAGSHKYADLKPKVVEHHFDLDLGGMKITGVIDLVDQNNRVIDWKTGATAPGQFAAERNRQLTLYDLAWRKETGTDPSMIGIIWGGVQAKGPRFEERFAEPRQQRDFDRVTNAFYTLDKAVKGGGPWHPAEEGHWICSRAKCPYYADCKVRA